MGLSEAVPVCKGTALGLLEETGIGVFAAFGASEAVGYLVCDHNGDVFVAGEVAEKLA